MSKRRNNSCDSHQILFLSQTSNNNNHSEASILNFFLTAGGSKKKSIGIKNLSLADRSFLEQLFIACHDAGINFPLALVRLPQPLSSFFIAGLKIISKFLKVFVRYQRSKTHCLTNDRCWWLIFNLSLFAMVAN